MKIKKESLPISRSLAGYSSQIDAQKTPACLTD